MSESSNTRSEREQLFLAFLNKHNDDDWHAIIRELRPLIHEVDRTATEIWIHFFPLALSRALERSPDQHQLARKLSLEGKYLLEDQIDQSHRFFYGHRYWPQVKQAVSELAASSSAPESLELARLIHQLASQVAERAHTDASIVIGITAVAVLTLQQVGAEKFRASTGTTIKSLATSPDRIVADRIRDDDQGFFSFLRPDKIFTVTFNESDPNAKFKLINSQHLTTAAANDKRDYHSREPRCIPGEGPIPVQCRSASCGTCWVGVLAGAEKLSEVRELESRRIKEFGYIDSDEPRPLIRLACQAQAFGNITIAIPPWNGVIGRHLRASNNF